MPLSEEENRLLEQMERALAAEDPKLASTMRGRTLERTARMRALVAAVVLVAGVGLLLAGAMTGIVILGVAGFLVMLAAAVVGVSAWTGRSARAGGISGVVDGSAQGAGSSRGSHPSQSSQGFAVLDGGRRGSGRSKSRPKKKNQSGTFMQRMEQRWERRRNEGL